MYPGTFQEFFETFLFIFHFLNVLAANPRTHIANHLIKAFSVLFAAVLISLSALATKEAIILIVSSDG